MYRQTYLFYPAGQVEASAVCVKETDCYTRERGYGFIVEENGKQDPDLTLPELNGGFLPVPWYSIPWYSIPMYSMSEDFGWEGRQIPLRFKCRVPEPGSYRIKIVIQGKEKLSDLRIFTGRRCLAAYQDELPAGKACVREMCVEVCGIIPRGREQKYEDNCIEVAVTADRPCISRVMVEKVQCPVLYIAGDSTVADQSAEYPYAPGASYAGWGQMMPYFVAGEMPVSNHAHSGLTTESFREEGHYAIIMEQGKAGDYMLFQFGHNDQKLMHLKAQEGYLANLERYIGECRDKGMYPLLVTPVARNSWRGSDGAYNDLLEEYAGACLELGAKLSVPVLDLHRLSMEFVLRLGKEVAKKYFFPSDYTHHNDFGAQQMAAMVCQEIKRVCGNWKDLDDDRNREAVRNGIPSGYRWLADQIREDVQEILWDEPACIEPLQRPEGFVAADDPEEFEEPDRPEDWLLRAEGLEMVVRRAGFFQINVYNDLLSDVIGHEWYAGTVECGLQNGIVTKDMCPDGRFRPLEPVTRLEFVLFLMTAYESRRTLPEDEPCVYDDLVSARERKLVSAACQLGVLAPDGTEPLNGFISRREGARMCRNLKIM